MSKPFSSPSSRRRLLLTLVTVAAASLFVAYDPVQLRVEAQGDPCGTATNPTVCENAKTGNFPSEWEVQGAGDSSVQGFATDISVNRGDTVRFKIDTTAAAVRLDI